MGIILRKSASIKKALGIALLVALTSYFSYDIVFRPSNERDWSTDLAVLPTAEVNGNLVTIRNIRNFTYRDVLDYTPGYYDKTFDLTKLKTVDFIVEPFSGLAAHTFVAFGFEDGSFIDISVEVRREKGEFFNAIKGLFRQFEITYVIADERDVLKLRTNYRKDTVYLYPIKTTPEKMQRMFLSMVNRANTLQGKPEFYHTLLNNCTTNIVEHVNSITPKRVPWSLRYILPKNSDELAYEIGLIEGDGTIDELRLKHNISHLAQKYSDDPDFSKKIREEIYGK